MAKTNKSRFALLGVLSFGPASGYDIKKTMQGSTAHFWRETDGSIYPILKELENEALVEVTLTSQGARAKKVYAITASGKAALNLWLKAPDSEDFVRNELLLKLFFSAHLPAKVTKDRIQEYKKRLLVQQKIFKQIEKSIKMEHATDKNLRFWLMTLRYGQLHVAASLQWCQEVL